jgi:flavin reductase (DIM6/NTAB) family NADH-FMN oxidoreductase RutF
LQSVAASDIERNGKDLRMPEPTEQIGPVLGSVPSGLFILTVRSEQGEETGMLASWVQQAGFSPPALTVAVNKQRWLDDWLREGTAVVVNLVGENQKQFLGHFGKGFEPGDPAFQGLAVERTPAGVPLLSEAVGCMEGRLAGSLDAGDHTIYLVQLTTAGQGTGWGAEKPYVHIRRNGLGY